MHEVTPTDNRKVRIEVGRTVNLGDFNSLRVSIAIEDDARAGENIDTTINRIYNKVHNAVAVKVDEALRAEG